MEHHLTAGRSPVRGVPILMYHRVPQDTAQRCEMAVPLADFAAQMSHLAVNRIAVLSLDDFISLHRARKMPSQPSVVLTFDDGYAATCANIEAVLDQYGYDATLFLATGFVGRHDPLESSDEGILTWQRLRALRRLHVQAHTVDHPRLTMLSDDQARMEVRACKAIIEHELGHIVDHFAYPFGAYTGTVANEVRAADYRAACTVHRGPATLNDDLYRLHRVTVDGRQSLDLFARKVRTGYGSPRDRATASVRRFSFKLPGVHTFLEARRARHAGRGR